MKKMTLAVAGLTLVSVIAGNALAQNNDNVRRNVVDEVAWVVGDEAIFKSDIEEQYGSMLADGIKIDGNPYCVIPENMAVEKLYLHQAKIDTIEVSESAVQAEVDQRMNYFVANLGSKERVESYFRKPYAQIREVLGDMVRNNTIVGNVKENLTKNVKATPGDVRKYYNTLPQDSLPYVPMQVEVQVVTLNPTVPRQEVEDVKARLRDFSERINSGESNFSTLAILYSEDDGTRPMGGELGFHGRADFVPEFSNVAFNLNDPKKVSRIVETEYGFHIIQLIEKRGDQINCRHILLRPKVSQQDIDNAKHRLDSLRNDLLDGKFTFEEAARWVSMDKDSRNNNGIMMNQNNGTSRFEMQDLPPEMARYVESMKPGDVSEAFVMKDVRKNKDVVCIVRLKDRIEGHKASLQEDYNMIKSMYENHAKEQILRAWVEKKIQETPVRIGAGWDNCDFKYSGWIK